MDQIVYIKSGELASDDEKMKVPPYDKNMEVIDYGSFKDKYLGEYIAILKSNFIGAVIGFEGENTQLWNDGQFILFVVCVIFNSIVLMNVLLALVGE